MSDDVDDPFAEEDAACEERVRLWREAEERKWANREGLIKLGTRPQEATGGFRRSLPSARDAARLFELVEAELGERAVRDAWSTPTERCLLVRDPEHAEWFLPQRLMYLQTEHHKNPPIPMHLEVPERIKRIVARKQKNAPPEEPPEEAVVVPRAPGQRAPRACTCRWVQHGTVTGASWRGVRNCARRSGKGPRHRRELCESPMPGTARRWRRALTLDAAFAAS